MLAYESRNLQGGDGTWGRVPIVSTLYPHWYQVKLEAWKRGEIDWEGNRLTLGGDSDTALIEKSESSEVTKLLAYLRLDNMPGIMAFISQLSRAPAQSAK
jgi:hypothetical protein